MRDVHGVMVQEKETVEIVMIVGRHMHRIMPLVVIEYDLSGLLWIRERRV